jgi:release factor glutamine methyltransferase
LRTDITLGLSPEMAGHFDMIVSNPPYISSSEWDLLDPEVRREPTAALSGGTDGLEIIKPIIEHARTALKARGFLLLEIGYNQGPAVMSLLETGGFSDVQLRKDFSGHDRMVAGRKQG